MASALKMEDSGGNHDLSRLLLNRRMAWGIMARNLTEISHAMLEIIPVHILQTVYIYILHMYI